MTKYICADCGCVTKSNSAATITCPDCGSSRMATEAVIEQVAGKTWRESFDRYAAGPTPHEVLVIGRLINGMPKSTRRDLAKALLGLQLRDGNEDRNPLLYGFARLVDEEETRRLCDCGSKT